MNRFSRLGFVRSAVKDGSRVFQAVRRAQMVETAREPDLSS